jgi:hypothetical protein
VIENVGYGYIFFSAQYIFFSTFYNNTNFTACTYTLHYNCSFDFFDAGSPYVSNYITIIREMPSTFTFMINCPTWKTPIESKNNEGSGSIYLILIITPIVVAIIVFLVLYINKLKKINLLEKSKSELSKIIIEDFG